MSAHRFRRWRPATIAAVLLLAAGLPLHAQGFRLRDLAGAELSEADLAHGTTIAIIWACWSPRSRDIVERVNPLAARWGGKGRVITVDFQEDRPAVERFLAGKGLKAPVFLDTEGAFSKHYAVATLPGLVVVKDGQVLYHGKLPDDADHAIEEALR